jgi:hypothetical protein
MISSPCRESFFVAWCCCHMAAMGYFSGEEISIIFLGVSERAREREREQASEKKTKIEHAQDTSLFLCVFFSPIFFCIMTKKCTESCFCVFGKSSCTHHNSTHAHTSMLLLLPPPHSHATYFFFLATHLVQRTHKKMNQN